MFEMKNKNANDDKSNDENSNSLINIHKTKEEESIEKILNLQKKNSIFKNHNFFMYPYFNCNNYHFMCCFKQKKGW